MSTTKSSILLLVAALVLLAVSAATTSAPVVSHILVALAVLCGVGLIYVAGKGSVAPPSPNAVPRVAGEWENWPKVLGTALFALVALLLWVALFISLHLGFGTWVIYPGVIMVGIWLLLIVLYTSGVTDKARS